MDFVPSPHVTQPWQPAAGASGGRRIMAAVWQVLTFVADCGMSVEQA